MDLPEPERPVNQTVHPLKVLPPAALARASRLTLFCSMRMLVDFGSWERKENWELQT